MFLRLRNKPSIVFGRKEKTMRLLFLGLIYLMFFLSGAAALIYQVVWVRPRTLIFGSSHPSMNGVLLFFVEDPARGVDTRLESLLTSSINHGDCLVS
jgi:hypothetical protein